MKLGYAILYVQDVPTAIDFYERAFGLKRRFLADEGTYGELDTGETRLGLSKYEFACTLTPLEIEKPSTKTTFPIELGFTTDDVESAFQKAIAEGAVKVKAPEEKPWGQVVAYVKDIDGYLVEICTPMP